VRDLGIEAQNHAAEIKVRAERRLGELLAEMPKQHGARGIGTRAGVEYLSDTPPALADLGVTKVESSRFQQMAAVPEPVFEQHVAETKASGEQLTTNVVLEWAPDLHESCACVACHAILHTYAEAAHHR
jgi:hypothetical protein